MFTFKKILFPVDFSERSAAAAPFVLSMAQRYGAKVTLLHAFEPPPPVYGGVNTIYPDVYDFTETEEALKSRLITFAASELPKVDTVCVVEQGFAAAVIVSYAEENGIDLIAMPTHGYGPFRRALLGSVTAKVLHDAKMPVWTDAHTPEPSHRAHPQPRQILVAIDLKPESRHILEAALDLARVTGASVEIVHAAAEGEVTPLHSEAHIHELLMQAGSHEKIAVAAPPVPEVDVVVDTEGVADLVRRVALTKRSDLIVIGRGAIQQRWSRWRGNAYDITREAPCPVLSI